MSLISSSRTSKKSCLMFAIALLFGLIPSSFPSPGCPSHLPIRFRTILKRGSDLVPQIRSTTNHPIPFSSTRDDLTESLTEEEESDVDSDFSSASSGLGVVAANRG